MCPVLSPLRALEVELLELLLKRHYWLCDDVECGLLRPPLLLLHLQAVGERQHVGVAQLQWMGEKWHQNSLRTRLVAKQGSARGYSVGEGHHVGVAQMQGKVEEHKARAVATAGGTPGCPAGE